MQVQVLFPAPNQYNPNQIFFIGDGFGLFVFFEKLEDTHFRNGVVKRPESKPRGPRKPKDIEAYLNAVKMNARSPERRPRFLADKAGRHSLCLPACMASELSLTAW